MSEINEILNLWEKYHEVCSLYHDKPCPSLINYQRTFDAKTIEERKELNQKNHEIFQKNKEIKQIIYIIENRDKIEKIIQYLTKTFLFSRKDIEENISFYDSLFALSCDDIFDKAKFFIELLGSKENFLSAMRVGTPLESLEDFYGKVFLGIMSYKKKHIFADKLKSLADILCLTRDEACKIFVSDWRYIYHSSQTTRKIIAQWCLILNITTAQLGESLKNHPCFLSHHESHLKRFIQSLQNSFLLSKDDAIDVILSNPDVVNTPPYSIGKVLSNANGKIPSIVSQKPWLYVIHEIILNYYQGYGYGDYKTILKFFEYIESAIGEIVDVEFESLNPLVRDGVRNIAKVSYTILIVKKRGFENEYCFVSFGSGYKSCNHYTESAKERLLQAIFKDVKKNFVEFIVDAPPLNSEEFETMLTYVFLMSSSGNIIPCYCSLKNGMSIVVKELSDQFEKFEYDNISLLFRTLDVIPTSELEKYKDRYYGFEYLSI